MYTNCLSSADFYEMFEDDAREAAKLLGLTLTARHKGKENENKNINAQLCRKNGWHDNKKMNYWCKTKNSLKLCKTKTIKCTPI